MYKSPIEIIIEDAVTEINNEIVPAFGYEANIDKEELLRALKYDREQYDEGFADGLKVSGSVVCCKECIHKGYGELGIMCSLLGVGVNDLWYCADGERESEVSE